MFFSRFELTISLCISIFARNVSGLYICNFQSAQMSHLHCSFLVAVYVITIFEAFIVFAVLWELRYTVGPEVKCLRGHGCPNFVIKSEPIVS